MEQPNDSLKVLAKGAIIILILSVLTKILNYVYKIIVHYSGGHSDSETTGTGNLGDLECSDKGSEEFCLQPNSYLIGEFRNYLITNDPTNFHLATFLNDVSHKFGSSGTDILNQGYTCNANHELIVKTPLCTSSQVCIVTGGTATCLEKIAQCNYPSANPFGLFY